MVLCVPNIGTYLSDNTMSYTRVLISTTTRASYLTEKICILYILFNSFLLFIFLYNRWYWKTWMIQFQMVNTMKLQEGWIKCFLCASSSWRLQIWVLCQNIANGNIKDKLDHRHRSLHSYCHTHIWVNSLEDKKPASTEELL